MFSSRLGSENVLFSVILVFFCFCFAQNVNGLQKNQLSITSKCSPSEIDKFDEVTARYLSLTEYQRKFPETHELIPEYCKTIKDDVSQMKEMIGKCLEGTAKQFGNVILFSYRTAVKQYCNGKSKRKDSIVIMAKCMNRNQKAGHTCLAKYVDSLQRGKRAEPKGNRIGYSCCDYFKFLSCLESVTRGNCSETESEKIQEFVRNLFQGIINTACGDFQESSDKCDKIPPPPKKKKSDKTYKSYFLPLVELWHSL